MKEKNSMAEKKKDKEVTEAPAQNTTDQVQKQVAVVMQYVKDLSFESPRAPQSLTQPKERPQIAVNVDVKATVANPEQQLYEVVLVISVNAKSGEDQLFVAELSYGGLFVAANLSEQEREQTLLIFCPNLLFPFARRVISDVTRDGGFPALTLDPIDFAQIYIRRKELAAQQAQA
jgi:preprotein translocase subunit SecB